jgi:pimeloyl-ACP methyl ester carboxylesterase
MPKTILRALVLLCVLCASAANPLSAATIPPAGNVISAEDRQSLGAEVDTLAKKIEALKASLKDKPDLLALLPDVEIYHKAVDWPLRYHELIEVKKARAALAHGAERAALLKAGKSPWVQTGGVRAYVSKIDGSIQPYLVAMPKGYDPAEKHAPRRLDFFYHGRNENLTELNFISGKGEARTSAGEQFLVQPYGRYCCANKFAGEIDTLEILDAMKKQYSIDPNRVVVTGFSMGGAACWHIAVHYADLWAAASPGAGFAETRTYQGMDKSGEWAALPWYRIKLMHLYDCPDYALNLSMLPLIAYAGTDDPQQQSGDIMQKAMADLGLKLERIYGPHVGHKYEPEAKKELDKRLDAYAAKGRNLAPKEIHFETWTLRYNHMYWVKLEGLEKHWERARVDAELAGPTSITVKTSNVHSLILDFPATAGAIAPDSDVSVTIDGQALQARSNKAKGLHAAFEKSPDKWKLVTANATADSQELRKRHALQGPIDDAFLDSFLIVKPSRPAINPKLEAWTKHELDYASNQWRAIFRGVPHEKNDHELTDKDIAENNLILFGDPSSNTVLAKIADKLPIKWNANAIKLGERSFNSADHAVVMIFPNPLNPKRYVVLNSGFTFRRGDHRTNSRQIAKLPDYAVIDLNTPPDDKAPGAIPVAGFFNEQWQLQTDDGKGNP